jgi:hypothetical protein
MKNISEISGRSNPSRHSSFLSADIFFVALIGALSLLYGCSQEINQDLQVYRKGEWVILRGQTDDKVVLRDKDAADVINTGIEMLGRQGGGEIRVTPGIYEMESPVRLTDFVTLRGSGKATVLKLGKTNEEGMVIYAEGVDNVVVTDLTVQGLPGNREELPDTMEQAKKPYVEEVFEPGKEFVYPYEPSGVVFHQVGTGQVRNVYARDFRSYGIWLRKDNFMCEVNSCITSGNGKAGVFLQHNNEGGRGGNHVPNLVIGCKSYGEEGNAYELVRSTCNNLVGNIVYQCRGHAFKLHGHSCSNLITGCRVFEGYRNAVYCEQGHETNVTGNIFCWNRGHGIEIVNTVWSTISGNNIIDAGGVVNYAEVGWQTGLTHGILLRGDTRSLQITGNSIFNWGDGHAPMIDGIHETAECRNNNIADNNINFYSGEAVNLNGRNSRSVNNLGIARFYGRIWEGPFMPDSDEPAQLLVPFDSQATERIFNKTRR